MILSRYSTVKHQTVTVHSQRIYLPTCLLAYLFCVLSIAVSVVCCYGREAKDEETSGEEQMNFRTKLGQSVSVTWFLVNQCC